MIEPNNGQAQDKRRIPQGDQSRYTGEILLRTRPKTYRAIVRELAAPNASVNGTSRRYRVSNHTVMGIREGEAKSIAERKKHLDRSVPLPSGRLGSNSPAMNKTTTWRLDMSFAPGVWEKRADIHPSTGRLRPGLRSWNRVVVRTRRER